MLPFRIGKNQQDLGNCVASLCPHCGKSSVFTLRRLCAALNIFEQPMIALDESHQLVCPQCKYFRDLPDEEVSAAKAAMTLLKQLEAKEIDEAKYLAALGELDFRTHHVLRDEAASWTCAACKEKVPNSLNACWKCNSARPGLLQSANSDTDSLPPLPTPITRPTHPWE
jgi:hypothetical protein